MQVTVSPAASVTSVRPVWTLATIALRPVSVRQLTSTSCHPGLGCSVTRLLRAVGAADLRAVEGLLGVLTGAGVQRERVVGGVGDVALEAELLLRGAGRRLDPLAHDDRAARRRGLDVVGVAEDVLGALGEADPLDVVAVEVVDRAAQRAEPVLPGEELVEDRVGGRPALDPQAVRAGGAVGLGPGQLDRHRALDLTARRLRVGVQQRRLGLRRRRARVGLGDDRERAPGPGDGLRLDPLAELELPVGQRGAVRLVGVLDRRADRLAGLVGRVLPEVLEALLDVVARAVGGDVRVLAAEARGDRHEQPGAGALGTLGRSRRGRGEAGGRRGEREQQHGQDEDRKAAHGGNPM